MPRQGQSLDALWHRAGGIHDLRLTTLVVAQFAPHSDTLISQALEATPVFRLGRLGQPRCQPLSLMVRFT